MGHTEEFRALGLSDDMLEAISKKGFETPSPIQKLTIPYLFSHERDIIAQAQTGTGKTAAFGLPILQSLTERRAIPQAIVLVPTRELALQVTQELISFNVNNLSIAPIYGGASISEQLRRLKKGIDIVVGTPGRLLDHIRRRTLDLSEISYLVLDEADEMLNMGFIEDIEAIMSEMTGPKRVLLFSATMPERIAAMARKYMDKPELLKVESKNITADLTNQIYFEVRESDKLDALTRIIDVEPDFYGIVFARTKVGTDDITARLLERGYSAEGLHGDISQAQREKILGKFKKKNINILVATDVAARGIDVSNLTHVINYSLPQDSDSYVHRIGRTGRAGQQGTAITFISPTEMRQFGYLKRNIKADIKLESLPTPADVIAIKRNKIKEDLYGIVESENYTECEGMAAELLETYEPRVALSALLRLAFNNELSESSYPEIRSINVDRKGKARIFIAIGFRDGYDPRKLVKLLKRECGLSDHQIDDIKMSDDFSFATVPFGHSDKVIRALNRLSSNRPIAEIAKEDKESGTRRKTSRRSGDTAEGDRPAERKPRAARGVERDVQQKPSAQEPSRENSSDGSKEEPAARSATKTARPARSQADGRPGATPTGKARTTKEFTRENPRGYRDAVWTKEEGEWPSEEGQGGQPDFRRGWEEAISGDEGNWRRSGSGRKGKEKPQSVTKSRLKTAPMPPAKTSRRVKKERKTRR